MDETSADSSEVQSFHFPDFGSIADSPSAAPTAPDGRSRLRVEYGRTELTRGEIADWKSGSTIVLPQAHSDPVTVLLDDQPIARGELVEMDGKICVRIVALVSDAQSARQSA